MSTKELLRRMADYLDKAGKPNAPIRLNCSYESAKRAGCVRVAGELRFESHPIVFHVEPGAHDGF